MRNAMTAVAILASMPAASATPPPELPPGFINIAAVEERAWLTMECAWGATKTEAICTFTQLRIEQNSVADVTEAVAKFKADYSKDASETRKELAKMCSEWTASFEKGRQAKLAGSRGNDAARIRMIELLEAPCLCRDDACRVQAFGSLVEAQERVCRVLTSSFTATLRRVGKDKWVNSPAPAGVCNAVTAIVVERKPPSSWTFTQTRITVDTDDTFCAGMAANVNRPYVFSSDAASTFKVDCEFVTPSLIGW